MRYQSVSYEKIGTIGVIRITGLRGDQESVFQNCAELADLCREIAWDEDVRVVILTGASPDAFSMELDSATTSYGYETTGGVEIKFRQLAECIAKIDRPVIAAINGDTIGQGLEMILACDVRIAAKTCHFAIPHIQSGIIPWDGGTQRLSRIVGKANALELLLTGKRIDAGEALRIGLVNEVVTTENLMTVAVGMGKEIASKGPIALRYVKEAVHKGLDMTLDHGLRLEADLYLLLHTTLDRTEGVRAFKEKRKPEFKGQ